MYLIYGFVYSFCLCRVYLYVILFGIKVLRIRHWFFWTIYILWARFFFCFIHKIFKNSLRRIQNHRNLYFYIRSLCAICESICMSLSWCFVCGTILHIYIYIYILFIWISNKAMIFCLVWIIYYFFVNYFFFMSRW